MKSDSAPNAAHANASAASSSKTRGAARIGLIVVAVAGILWLGSIALHHYRYVETDDAFTAGHLHSVSSQLDGQVADLLVKDNQKVKKGEVLLRLDARPWEISLEKARAAQAQAEAQKADVIAAISLAESSLKEVDARIAQSQAQVRQSEAQLLLARQNLTRIEQLFGGNGAVTQADLDNARASFAAGQANNEAASAALKANEASRNSALASLASTRAKSGAADAAILAAQASVNDAERLLSYAIITAPADGRVGNRKVEVGNRIVSGQALMSLAEDECWVIANFKETQISRMQAGHEADITVDSIPGVVLHGTIESLSPASGAQFALLPPDNATGNFNKVVQRVPVKILLDPKEIAPIADRLRLGLSVIVEVRVR